MEQDSLLQSGLIVPMLEGNQVDIQHGNNQQLSFLTTRESYHSLREFITSDEELSWYAEVTGLLLRDDNSVQKHSFRWTLVAYYLIHIMFIVGTILLLAIMFICAYDRCIGLGVDDMFYTVQNVIIYLSVLTLRVAINRQRSINDTNMVIYNKLMREAISLSYRFVISYVVLISLIFIIMSSLFTELWLSFIILMFGAFVFLPSTVFSGLILAYLIFEVRASYFIVSNMYESIQKQILSLIQYFHIRSSLVDNYRDNIINLVVIGSLINMGASIYMSWIVRNYDYDIAYVIPYAFVVYSKPYVMLIIILLEILRVNSKIQNMIKVLTLKHWDKVGITDVEEGNGNHRLSLPGKGTIDNERMSIYIAMKENPIGSTIFYYRPTKTQLVLQLLSLIIVVVTVILRVIILAWIL